MRQCCQLKVVDCFNNPCLDGGWTLQSKLIEWRINNYIVEYNCYGIFCVISISVVKRTFTAKVFERTVIRGNTGVLRCHISDADRAYIQVKTWLVNSFRLNAGSIGGKLGFNIYIYIFVIKRLFFCCSPVSHGLWQICWMCMCWANNNNNLPTNNCSGYVAKPQFTANIASSRMGVTSIYGTWIQMTQPPRTNA